MIHSARIIPGNDRSVFDLLNALERRGIEVIARHLDPKVHVSGHAYREEQRTLLSTLQPKSFVPIHGTFLHLRQHAALANEVDVHDVHIVQNGDVVQVDEGRRPHRGLLPDGPHPPRRAAKSWPRLCSATGGCSRATASRS